MAQGGDSGELATEGCTFGIAHPPGYPLLTLIGNILSRLPTSPGTSTVKLTNLFNAGAHRFPCRAAGLLLAASGNSHVCVLVWCRCERAGGRHAVSGGHRDHGQVWYCVLDSWRCCSTLRKAWCDVLSPCGFLLRGYVRLCACVCVLWCSCRLHTPSRPSFGCMPSATRCLLSTSSSPRRCCTLF